MKVCSAFFDQHVQLKCADHLFQNKVSDASHPILPFNYFEIAMSQLCVAQQSRVIPPRNQKLAYLFARQVLKQNEPTMRHIAAFPIQQRGISILSRSHSQKRVPFLTRSKQHAPSLLPAVALVEVLLPHDSFFTSLLIGRKQRAPSYSLQQLSAMLIFTIVNQLSSEAAVKWPGLKFQSREDKFVASQL